MENIYEILYQFGIQSQDLYYEQIISGHINNTFKIYSGKSEYILQKVNTDVFRNPEQIMHNISIVQELLKQKADPLQRFPEYLKSNGKNYCICDGFWRIYRYIESTDVSPDKNSVSAFGKILGKFHKDTENASVSELYLTIPDFHNIEKNIRKVMTNNQISSWQSGFYSKFLDFYNTLKKYFSPVRLVHNDIKWANVLTDPMTRLPDTLIDFDTVMPGYAAFDFGDGVRSACITESNQIDYELLKAFSKGYFTQYQNINFNEAAAGILSVSAELSARYLYDALSGNEYFSGMSKDEKLTKCYNNLKLAEYTLNRFKEIEELISLSVN